MKADTGSKLLSGHSRPAAEDVFPPQTSRVAEIDAFLELLRGVLANRSAVYVSAPITSGRRFVEWYARRENSDVSSEEYQRDHVQSVIGPNRSAAVALVKKARDVTSGPVIDPTAVGNIEGWTQGDYRTAWARVIEKFANTVVFSTGWEFSNGCSYEFLVATKAGIKTLDDMWRPLDPRRALALLSTAIDELSSRNLPVEFLRGLAADLATLTDGGISTFVEDRGLTADSKTFKDAVLDSLASHGNVAQFVSFSPALQIRYSRILGFSPNATFESVSEAILALLNASVERSVNVRSYHPDHPKSREFIYGLRRVEDVEAALQRLGGNGLYTIVNETVDVNDGGVSGVALDDVIEFAPGDTPRCVEKPGTLSLPRSIGLAMLQRVYGFAPTFPAGRWRIEFSVHPVQRGHRSGHTILWEAEPEISDQKVSRLRWPNRFSRFVGDKAFGLLLADCLGFPVPSTHVVSRAIAPFSFGKSTGTGEPWIRTCPFEPVPGKFTTRRGWTDPFKLLAAEDPDGQHLASVLSQEGVRAVFSGASIASCNKEPIIEGVSGIGSDFMLGRQSAEQLPSRTIASVKELVQRVNEMIGGTIKVEWAFDEDLVWILQLQQLDHDVYDTVIVPGESNEFRHFETTEGIDRFRDFVEEARKAGAGVILRGAVGITSHFGDILRRSRVPSRIEHAR
jgi:hypothetical protein